MYYDDYLGRHEEDPRDIEHEKFLDLVDKGERFERAQEFVEALIEEMYGDADITRIEDYLEEIAGYYEIDLPKHDIPLIQG